MMISVISAPLASADIDWTRGQPTIRIDDDSPVCDEMQEKVIDWTTGEIKQTDVCVVYGKNFDMAYTYGTKNGGSSDTLLRLHGAAEFSAILGVGDVQVAPGTNMVVYNKKGMLRPLALVRDFTQALKPEHFSRGVEFTDRVIDFKVNASVFDYEFLTTTTTATGDGVTSFKVSGDGRYVITYFNNTGIVKYNLDTRQMIKVATVSSLGSWNSYSQPRIEAVSNDGRFIFLASAGQIIDTENCGDTTTPPFGSDTQILHICRMRDNTEIIKGLVGDAVQIQGARFGEDDNTLNFLTRDNDANVHRIVMGATDIKIIKYLALGDSYSSGEGDVSYSSEHTNYLPGTEDRNECHISYRSYPFLLREKWSIDFNDMRSVACSGARVTSDYYGDGEYTGQHHELEGKDNDEKAHVRSDTLNNFAPSIIRQIDFVAKYKPDTITFTGGGNDVGFGEIIAYCADPTKSKVSCPQVSDPQISANLRRAIDDMRGSLTEFIQQAKEASPATKIYLIGYPQFVALDGCNAGSVLLNEAERLMIRSSVIRLNNILKLVARDTDVYYVDIEDSLEGGQVCQLNSFYMTGPLKVLGRIVEGYTQEAYHPNANGHKKIADAINARVRDNNLSYRIINIPTEKNGQRMVRTAVTKDYAGVGSEQTIAMDSGMFEEDGTVDAVMYSNRVPLAKIKVQHDGTLNAKVKIPPEIEPGMHLLTLTGKSVTGDIVQVQQYITIYNDKDDLAMPNAKSSSLLSNVSPNNVISDEATGPLSQTLHPRLSLDMGLAMNYEKADNQSTVMRHIFMILVTITLIIAIIVKGTLYARKKAR